MRIKSAPSPMAKRRAKTNQKTRNSIAIMPNTANSSAKAIKWRNASMAISSMSRATRLVRRVKFAAKMPKAKSRASMPDHVRVEARLTVQKHAMAKRSPRATTENSSTTKAKA